MRALVVDDDVFLGELYTSLLSDIGIKEVDYCSSGYEALKTLRETHYDLVITDYRMANGDGGSLSHFCSDQSIKYLVLTAYESGEVEPYLPADAKIVNKVDVARSTLLQEEVSKLLNLNKAS